MLLQLQPTVVAQLSLKPLPPLRQLHLPLQCRCPSQPPPLRQPLRPHQLQHQHRLRQLHQLRHQPTTHPQQLHTPTHPGPARAPHPRSHAQVQAPSSALTPCTSASATMAALCLKLLHPVRLARTVPSCAEGCLGGDMLTGNMGTSEERGDDLTNVLGTELAGVTGIE